MWRLVVFTAVLGLVLWPLSSIAQQADFQRAAMSGDITAIETSIEAGADVNGPLFGGETPLDWAAASGNIDAVKVLLAKGANPNPDGRRGNGMTPLRRAVENGHVDIAHELLAHGAAGRETLVDIARTSAAEFYAGSPDSRDQMLALLQTIPPIPPMTARQTSQAILPMPDTSNLSPQDTANARLLVAAHNGDDAGIEMALTEGADVNATGINDDTALGRAAFWGHRGIVERLIARGATVDSRNSTGATPLILAARGGEDEIVELLLRRGADPNATDERGATALKAAAQLKSSLLLRELVMGGADINARDKEGWTLLLWAIKEKHSDDVTMLLDAGADLSLRPTRWFAGASPLQIAARFQRTPEVVSVLLDHGADPNVRWGNDLTPLHEAAGNGSAAVVEALIVHGADINAQLVAPGHKGVTPLMYAVGFGRYDTAKLLIDHGADLSLRDWTGATALDVARNRPYKPDPYTREEMITLLERGEDTWWSTRGLRPSAASFDCSKAQTSREKLICTDPGLAALDKQMAALYRQNFDTLLSSEQSVLRAAQRAWLRFLDNFCPVPEAGSQQDAAQCLRIEYQRWLSELVNPRQPALTVLSTSVACPVESDITLHKIPKPPSADGSKPAHLKIGSGAFPDWSGRRPVAIDKINDNPIATRRLLVGPLDADDATPDDDWVAQQHDIRRFGMADFFTQSIGPKGVFFSAIYFARPGRPADLPASEVLLRVMENRLIPICAVTEPILRSAVEATPH